MRKVKIFGRLVPAWLLVALLVGAPAMALITYYVKGTVTGTVEQAITIQACNVDIGTCTIEDTSFTWNMGSVYQGSSYLATITLYNSGNGDITVVPQVGEIRATGGNEVFEGSVIIEPETVTVPAGETASFTVNVTIHPAEEPEENYSIPIFVVPPSE